MLKKQYIYGLEQDNQTSDIVLVLRKEFLDTQATIECGFTLKHVRDMVITYNHTLPSISKQDSNHEKQIILLMIRNGDRWHYIAV